MKSLQLSIKHPSRCRIWLRSSTRVLLVLHRYDPPHSRYCSQVSVLVCVNNCWKHLCYSNWSSVSCFVGLQGPAVFVSHVPSHSITQPNPNAPEDELRVGMTILGKKRTKTWHRGTLVSITPVGVWREDFFFLKAFSVTHFALLVCTTIFKALPYPLSCSGDNVFKYKVKFDNKGKSLLSGNHVAFDYNPTLEVLYVGARVVAKYRDGNLVWLYAGIVAEMPNTKNQMR